MKAILISSLEKVLKHEAIDGINELSSYSMLRNERFSFELLLHNDSGNDKNVMVRTESRINSAVSINQIGYVYINKEASGDVTELDYYIHSEDHYIPDALLPIENDTVSVPANENVSLLITVNGDTAPIETGRHDIKIRLSDGCETDICKVFELSVINALLPEQKLMYTNWFYLDSIAESHKTEVFSEKFWELTEKYMIQASRTGINMILTPVVTPALDTAVNGERLTTQLVDIKKTADKYEFEFSKLYRFIALAQKCGMKYFEITHLFTQWGAEFTPKIEVEIDGKKEKLFGWHVKALDESYKEFLSQFLPALVDVLKKAGAAKNVFFHISDEPSSDEAVEQYRKCREMVEPYIGGFVIMDALSNPIFYEEGVVNYPVPDTGSIHKFMHYDIKDRWTYYCCGPWKDASNRFTSIKGGMTRVLGCQLYKFNIAGFLHWGFNQFYSLLSKQLIDPFVKNDYDNFPSGDGYIVYPYGDDVIGSIRQQQFYDALQDLRAFELLGSVIGKDQAVKIIEDTAGSEIDFTHFPMNNEFPLECRAELNKQLSSHFDKR